jgi:hypothetical protein
VLLLQPWSTATIQTTKSRIAPTPRVLSHIITSAEERIQVEAQHG